MESLDPLPLRTSRLVLRRFAAADAAAFHAYRNDPAVAQYQGWESCAEEEAAEFVGRHAAQPFGVPGQWLQIAIARKESNELLGDCALKIHAHDPRQATIGVTFARVNQRQGYATEALRGLLDLLFLRLNLHRVVADTDPENSASWKMLERLGFHREGHLRGSLWFKSRWADEYLYAILHEAWQERRGAGGTGLEGF